MTDSTTSTDPQLPSRRDAIRLLAGGVAALAMGACTPATMLLKVYPEQYRPGSASTDTALLAFIDTVVPGLTRSELNSITVLQDRFYPIAKYSDFMASDLDRRAERHYERPFASLTLSERTAIVEKALNGDHTARKLYTGAVFLTQAAVYGGIHDDRAGCRLTAFPGGYRPPAPTQISYAASKRFTARALSREGNPA